MNPPPIPCAPVRLRAPMAALLFAAAALAAILAGAARADDRLFSTIATKPIPELVMGNDRYLKVTSVKFAGERVTFEHDDGVTTLPVAEFDAKNLELLFPGYIARKAASDEAKRQAQQVRENRWHTDRKLALANVEAAVAEVLKTPATDSDPPCVCVIAAGHDTYEVSERPAIEVRIVNRSTKTVHLARSFGRLPQRDWSASPEPLGFQKGEKCDFEVADPTGHLCPINLYDSMNHCLIQERDLFSTLPRIPEIKIVVPGEAFVPLGPTERKMYPFSETYSLFQRSGEQPGTYTVRFHYSTEGLSEFVENTTTDVLNNERWVRVERKIPASDLDNELNFIREGLKTIFTPELDAQLKRIPKLDLKSNLLKLKFVPRAE